MPALTLPLTAKVSQMTSGSTGYRWNTAKFGNGYEQRVPDGINYQQRKYTVTYDNIGTTDFNTVQAFCNSAGTGQYFTWTPPGESVSMKWVIDGEVTVSVRSGNVFTISIPIRQVYDLA